MDYKEPKITPEPTYAEQPEAQEGRITIKTKISDEALTNALASMASAMACLVDDENAAELTAAAATLMEGGSDGDA